MQRPEAAPETRSPFSFKRFGCRTLGVGRRGGFPIEIWEFRLPKGFNFSSAPVSTSLQCREEERAVSMWQDLPSSGKM